MKLRSPSTIFLAGSTQTGKTRFALKLIDHANEMFEIPPSKIVYCYTDYQDIFSKYEHVLFYEGLPPLSQIEEWSDGREHLLIILDDLLLKVTASEDCVHLFTVTSHHRLVSCIFISQAIFPPGKYSTVLSRQMCYIVLFKNLRDVKQVTILGSQLYPRNSHFLKDAFDKAMTSSNYLFIDLNPCSPDKLRLRTDIFPGEFTRVFVPLDFYK